MENKLSQQDQELLEEMAEQVRRTREYPVKLPLVSGPQIPLSQQAVLAMVGVSTVEELDQLREQVQDQQRQQLRESLFNRPVLEPIFHPGQELPKIKARILARILHRIEQGQILMLSPFPEPRVMETLPDHLMYALSQLQTPNR